MGQTNTVTINNDKRTCEYQALPTGAVFRFIDGDNYYLKTDRAGNNGPVCVLLKNGLTYSPAQYKQVQPLAKGTPVNIEVGGC